MIGLVLLVGLVSKNSILLVDLINQYRIQGMDTNEAITAACPRRMRPVLITSLTIILAMMPAALGVGSESVGHLPPLPSDYGGNESRFKGLLLAKPSPATEEYQAVYPSFVVHHTASACTQAWEGVLPRPGFAPWLFGPDQVTVEQVDKALDAFCVGFR